MSQYKMIGENMLVREENPANEKTTKSGLVVVSDSAENFLVSGIVEEVSAGQWHGEVLTPLIIKVGDRVWFNKKPGNSVPFEPVIGEKFFLVRQTDCYAYETLN